MTIDEKCKEYVDVIITHYDKFVDNMREVITPNNTLVARYLASDHILTEYDANILTYAAYVFFYFECV